MKTLPILALGVAFTTPAMAIDMSQAMSSYVDQNILAWAADPVIVDAVKAQNVAHASLTQGDIDELDLKWRAEVGKADQPTIKSVLENSASAYLRDQVTALGGQVTEVFVMDNHGLNVASSGVTSDHWQGDEDKFTATFGVGPDARHFSEVEKDESTGTYQAQASFVVVDPETSEPIGAVTVGINAEALQ